MAVNCETCDGDLAIDGVDMRREAWCVLDLLPLWMPAAVRGADRLLPGSPGVIAFPRRATVTARSLPMVIAGDVNWDGDLVSVWVGFQQNIDYLRDNVVDPTGVGDGTRVAVLTLPDGSVRTGDVHVLGLTPGRTVAGPDGVYMRATLDLSIPGGVLV